MAEDLEDPFVNDSAESLVRRFKTADNNTNPSYRAQVDSLKGDKKEISWGSQIRSYVFTPYTMVKDHRTSYEVAQVDKVMDGDLDGFIDAYLKWRLN